MFFIVLTKCIDLLIKFFDMCSTKINLIHVIHYACKYCTNRFYELEI